MFFEFAPVEQSHVGVLPFAEPLEGGGQEDAVDFRGTGDAGGQCGDVAHGGVGVGESDGGEAFLHGVGGQFHLFVVEAGVDGQHGPVVDVHVQVAHFTSGFVVFVDEFLGVHVEGPGESAQFEVVVEFVVVGVAFAFDTAETGFAEVREQVGAFERPHLLAVFHDAFEAVVPGELLGLSA